MEVSGFGRHYITMIDAGDVNQAQKIMMEITAYIKNMMKDRLISGYLIRVLYDEDNILDERLEVKEILLFSEGKLPVIFLNIAYNINQENKQALEQMVEKFEMRMFKAFSIK